MKLPSKVRIAGSGTWRIVRRTLTHTTTHKGKATSKRYYGFAYSPTKTIAISWGLNDEQILSTYIHEICHATVPDLDEEAVQRLEATLVEALRRIGEG